MRRLANRAVMIPLLIIVALLLFALPASSAPRVPNGEPIYFLSPSDEFARVCDFTVEVTGTNGQLDRATLPNGLVIIAGPAVATVTNLDNGASATYNASGPYKYDPATNRVTVFGQNLILGPEGSTGPDGPFLIVTSGQVSFILNQPIDVPLRGHVSHDVCAELA